MPLILSMLTPLLLALGTVILVLLGLSTLSYFLGAPYYVTKHEVVEKAVKLAETRKGEKFYDLGSGSGRVVRKAAEAGADAIGVEINPAYYLWAQAKKVLRGGKERYLLQSFHTVDLRDADVVYLYTWQKTNQRLQKKLWKELKPGARVVTLAFTLPNWKPAKTDKKNLLYLYKR